MGNQTQQVASDCNGKTNCRFVADNRFGDPAFGCSKDFSTQWRCGDDSALRTVRYRPAIGEGYEVALSCEKEIQTGGPSFRCSPNASGMEGVICGDSDLAQLDGDLADLYRKTLAIARGAHRQKLIDKQRSWISLRNRSCPTDTHDSSAEAVRMCVTSLYEARLEGLRDERKKQFLTWEGPELRPGQSAITNDLVVQCLSDHVRVAPSDGIIDRDSPDFPDNLNGPPVYGTRGDLQSSYADCKLADGTEIRVKSGQQRQPMPYGQCGAAPGEMLSVWVDHRKMVTSFGYAGPCEDSKINSLVVQRLSATVCLPPKDGDSGFADVFEDLRAGPLDKSGCTELPFTHSQAIDTREFPDNGAEPPEVDTLTLQASPTMYVACKRLLPVELGQDPAVPESVAKPAWQESQVDLKQPDIDHVGFNATTLSLSGTVQSATFDLENTGNRHRIYMLDSSNHWFDGTALAVDANGILSAPFDAHDDVSSLRKGIHVWVYDHAEVFFYRGQTYILLNPVNHQYSSRVVALRGRREEEVCTFHRTQDNF